jgi:hypothetical protein
MWSILGQPNESSSVASMFSIFWLFRKLVQNPALGEFEPWKAAAKPLWLPDLSEYNLLRTVLRQGAEGFSHCCPWRLTVSPQLGLFFTFNIIV